jgi:hypothetical protein
MGLILIWRQGRDSFQTLRVPKEPGLIGKNFQSLLQYFVPTKMRRVFDVT